MTGIMLLACLSVLFGCGIQVESEQNEGEMRLEEKNIPPKSSHLVAKQGIKETHRVNNNDEIILNTNGRSIIENIINDRPSDINTLEYFINKHQSLATFQLDVFGKSSTFLDPLLRYHRNKYISADFEKYRAGQLANILALCWAIYDMAKESHEAFHNGSYKIIDPDYRIYAFFKEYADNAMKESRALAYERNPSKGGSSHYKKESPESQFGFDLRFSQLGPSLPLLPNGFSHVLFGKIRMPGAPHYPLLFLKFETAGLGSVSDRLQHGYRAFKKVALKIKVKDAIVRKEDQIPHEISNAYRNVLVHAHQKVPKKLPSIAEQYRTVQNISVSSPELRGARAAFFEALKQQYPNDTEEYYSIRSGDEVIIDLRSFSKS